MSLPKHKKITIAIFFSLQSAQQCHYVLSDWIKLNVNYSQNGNKLTDFINFHDLELKIKSKIREKITEVWTLLTH